MPTKREEVIIGALKKMIWIAESTITFIEAEASGENGSEPRSNVPGPEAA